MFGTGKKCSLLAILLVNFPNCCVTALRSVLTYLVYAPFLAHHVPCTSKNFLRNRSVLILRTLHHWSLFTAHVPRVRSVPRSSRSLHFEKFPAQPVCFDLANIASLVFVHCSRTSCTLRSSLITFLALRKISCATGLF